jgi:hypothetical protein
VFSDIFQRKLPDSVFRPAQHVDSPMQLKQPM